MSLSTPEKIIGPSAPPIRPDASEEIPIFDLGAYRAGEPGALDRLGADMRRAFEEIGFYFIVNHGVPQSLIDATYAAAGQFHDQPLEAKMKLKIDPFPVGNNVGYREMRSTQPRKASVTADAYSKPALNEAFFAKRELPPDHPDLLAGKPFRGANKWPADLPGFREAVMAYQNALEQLALSLLPAYAIALDLPSGYFAPFFREPMYSLRMSHYPQQDAEEEGLWGVPPHADTSFMTLLAPNPVPGLSIRLPTGRWAEAPIIPGAFLVNGGSMLRRWTNDRFLATPHRVSNRSGRERYAIPFFFDCDYGAEMSCLPSCTAADNPPRYEPITYAEYMKWHYAPNDAGKKPEGVRLVAD